MQESLTQSAPDFIYTNSLNKVSKQLQIENKKGRIYMILHNPILGTLLSYKRHALSNNKRIIMESLNNNTFIKSILHKKNGYQVTKNDYDAAQKFLDDYVVYDIFQEYEKTLKTFLNEFDFSSLSSDSSQEDCVKYVFRKKVDYINRMYSKHILDSSSSDGTFSIDKDVVDALKGYDEYDNLIYNNALEKTYSDTRS